MLNTAKNIELETNINFVQLDEEGFILDLSDWNHSFSESRAALKGLELNDKHWFLIEYIRDKYIRLGALPPMRTVCKSSGLDKQELKAQFGSCLELWKIAGLPNPGEEAITYMN